MGGWSGPWSWCGGGWSEDGGWRGGALEETVPRRADRREALIDAARMGSSGYARHVLKSDITLTSSFHLSVCSVMEASKLLIFLRLVQYHSLEAPPIVAPRSSVRRSF